MSLPSYMLVYYKEMNKKFKELVCTNYYCLISCSLLTNLLPTLNTEVSGNALHST